MPQACRIDKKGILGINGVILMRRSWDVNNRNDNLNTEQQSGGIFEKLLGIFGFEPEEVEVESDTLTAYEEPIRRESSRERGKVVSLANANKSMKVIILAPTNFEDVQLIVDYLKNKQTVILNLEDTEKSVSRRIADFVGGAIYSLDGTMQRVSASIFLFTPAGVDVSLPLRLRDSESESSGSTSNFSNTLFRKDQDFRRS